MTSSATARTHSDGLITGFALACVLAWDASGLDMLAVRLAGGPGGFPLRNHWLTSGVLHEGGRLLAWAVLALLVLNVWRPLLNGLTRAQRWHWLLVTMFCLIAIPALKRVSSTSCPWDLAEFGGTAVHLSHWHLGVPDGGPGHCFPSGHAVSAFGFMWGWFVLRDIRPALARTWLAAVLTLGAAFGTAQLLRGAHYPSHTLWTAWLCWALCAALHRARTRRRAFNIAPRRAHLPPALSNLIGDDVV